jgi:hypothetical protein
MILQSLTPFRRGVRAAFGLRLYSALSREQRSSGRLVCDKQQRLHRGLPFRGRRVRLTGPRCVVIEPRGEGDETTRVHVIVCHLVQCTHRERYDSAHNLVISSMVLKVLIATHFVIFSVVF